MSRLVSIYTRVSVDDGSSASPARQEADCRRRCKTEGWTVAAVYTDAGLSAYRDVERPGFDRMVGDLAAGMFDTLMVWKLDRLTRKGVRGLWPILDLLDEHQVQLVSLNESIDTSTAIGEGMAALIASFGKQESQNTSLRVSSALRAAAHEGRPRNGRRAFGLTADWTQVVPEEAELIREAANRLLAGDSLRAVVLDWRARGVTTIGGKPFSTQVLRNMLLQRRLVGEREYHGAVVASGQWPAILDRATFDRVRNLLTDESRRTFTTGRRGLLTGLLWCGKCGHRLTHSLDTKGRRRYICKPPPEGCNGLSVLAEPCEDYVTRALLTRTAPVARRATRKATDTALAKVAALEAKLEEAAADYYVHGTITKPEHGRVRAELETRITQARSEANRLVALEPHQPATTPAAWERLTHDKKRSRLASRIERIDVAPIGKGHGKANPADRLTITWL